MSLYKKIFKQKPKTKVDTEKELTDFLSNVYLFKNLSNTDIRNLQNYIHKREYKQDEKIFKKGYPNIVMYIVKEGKLLRYLDYDKAKEEGVEIEAGHFFGVIGLFIDEKRTSTVIATKPSVLLAISKRDIKNFIAEYPKAGAKILYKIGKILSNDIVDANEQIVELEEENINLKEKVEDIKSEEDNG